MTEITWTNCADEMPPDTDGQVILRLASNREFVCKTSGENVNTWLFPKNYEWVPYTPEKWEELNK